eukprot:9221595-Ditylum_brightwellii.AAC.1
MENASIIQSTIGGGNHIKLGLVTKASKYFQLTGVTFAALLNLGLVLLAQHPFMTQAEVKNECQNHQAALVTHQTYNNTDKALHNQLIASIKDMYIKSLYQGIIRYSNYLCPNPTSCPLPILAPPRNHELGSP